MAKQRASLPLPRLSSTNLSEASSATAESNNARKIRTASVVSSTSTPPTSLPEESISDAASDKQAMDAQLNISNDVAKSDSTSRRSSRRSAGPTTYNVAALSGTKRAPSIKAIKAKEDRSFSGQTLVNEAEATSADTPHRKLLEDSLKTLDMDWNIDDVDGEASTLPKPTTKPKRRSSIHLMVDKAKKILGKRSRDDSESHQEGGRRSSRRLSALTLGQEKDDQGGEEHTVQRPSKMARLASSLSMPSLSATLGMPKPQQKPEPEPKPRERPVKKYQRQGLYVGQKPEDHASEKKKGKKRASTAMALEASVRQPFMPLPMFGALDAEKDFALPYNLFAPQWRERGTEKPKDWGKISKNRFVGDAKDQWRSSKLPTSLCACKDECGEDCWNRAMGSECDKNNCNVGPECSNRDFSELSKRMDRASKYDKKTLAYLFNAGVEVIKTENRGFGVRACREFQPNEIITEYIGEIITQTEAYRRINQEYAGKSDYYQMEFDQGMILDATRGSLARFVNHSCNPNCEMVKRNVSGQPRMALFAGEHGVMTGEELTYDYNFDPYSTTNIQKCLCGASNCRLVLGPKPAGEKKPSSKSEQLAMATDLKLTAISSKRKSGEAFNDIAPPELIKDLKKKRKVPQMSKGWAYIDEDMERQRLEEAEKDRELRRLQREGIVPEINISRPKYPSRSAIMDKIMTAVSSKGKNKEEDGPKPQRKSMMSRLSGSFSRVTEPDAATTLKEKRRSTLSTSGSLLHQSRISFQARNISSGSGEVLIPRPTSSGSAASKAAKRISVMSRSSSTKRNSTVRMVTEEDNE